MHHNNNCQPILHYLWWGLFNGFQSLKPSVSSIFIIVYDIGTINGIISYDGFDDFAYMDSNLYLASYTMDHAYGNSIHSLSNVNLPLTFLKFEIVFSNSEYFFLGIFFAL